MENGLEGARVEKKRLIRRPGKSSPWHASRWEKQRRRTPEQSAAFVKGLQKKTEKPKISFRFQV